MRVTGTTAGFTVQKHVYCMGVLLGNIKVADTYTPVIANMMVHVGTLTALLLGMEEKAYLFLSWVLPVVYLITGAACHHHHHHAHAGPSVRSPTSFFTEDGPLGW